MPLTKRIEPLVEFFRHELHALFHLPWYALGGMCCLGVMGSILGAFWPTLIIAIISAINIGMSSMRALAVLVGAAILLALVANMAGLWTLFITMPLMAVLGERLGRGD